MPKKKVTEAVEETAQETIPVEKAPAQMPRRQGSEDLLDLNDLERGVTREDSEEAKWGYLAGAVRRQQILTGIVSAGMTYARKGVKIYAAAIGEDRPRIERIYGDGYLDITNLQELPVMLTNLIVRSLPH